MEIRKAKMILNKSGSGNSTFRATLLNRWVRGMGLDEEQRELLLMFDGNKITILKEEVGMGNIIIGLSDYEGLKLTGVKLSSAVESDEEELKYYQIENGHQIPYRTRVERLTETWEVLKSDAAKEELEIKIIRTHYREGLQVESFSDKIIDLISYKNWTNKDLGEYGEIVKMI